MRSTIILEFENDLAKNQELWRLVESYIISQGSQETQASLAKMARVWVEILEHQGQRLCVGIASIAQCWMVPIFHCDDERARQRLVNRLSVVLEENQGGNTHVLVHVDAEVEDRWQSFLEAMEAKRAALWVVPVGPQLEFKEEQQAIEATD